MAEPILNDITHRRFNPLRGTHVLVSPHRNKRPWQGQREKSSQISQPAYDPECYLCPGNKRVQGQVNPNYGSTFVFANDYSAVQEEQAEYHAEHAPGSLAARLLQAEAVTGKCYVITFSPHHHITLADMKQAEILVIIQTWTNLYKLHLSPNSPLAQIRTADLPPLNQDDITKPSAQYRYMQIFENKGKEMGCSNPHPHGQIWTTTSLPEEPCMELVNLQKYKKEHGTHLLVDYAQLESEKKERTVCENRSFWAGVPHWAVWPFEIMIVSKRHKRALVDLDAREREELADTIAQITRHYDNLFETRFPYSMGMHQAPLEGTDDEIECSHFHMHFYPPLLRGADIKKFLVGYELLAEPQRDITPEQAAARLRNCGSMLYREKAPQ